MLVIDGDLFTFCFFPGSLIGDVFDPACDRYILIGRVCVGQRVAHYDHGIAGFIAIERNEGRVRFQLYLDRTSVVGVVDMADGILVREPNVLEALGVEGVDFAADLQCKTLVDRGICRVGFHVAESLGRVLFVFASIKVPAPEFAVAAKVDLPGADSVDRHADKFQVIAGGREGLAALIQTGDPLLAEFFVSRNDVIQFLFGKWPCHYVGWVGQQHGGRDAGRSGGFDKATAADGRRRTAIPRVVTRTSVDIHGLDSLFIHRSRFLNIKV